jgi:putative cell wall-binding protein
VRAYTTSGDVQRVGGANRYETAALLASYYPVGRTRVYLASGENFPDALSGAALAGHEQMPLLLARHDSLDPSIVAQLQRIRPGEVVVLGGPVAVSDAVARLAASYTTTGTYRRLAGDDRWATMRQVAAQFPAGTGQAFVASGQDFPDALVGAALAGGLRGVPIVLTANTGVPGPTAGALTRIAPRTMSVLGGPGVVTDATVGQLAAYLR